MSVVDGKTYREIAKELAISLETVVSDIRYEAQLRAEERSELREADLAVQLAMTERVYQKSMDLADRPGVGALPTAAKAAEMRSKLLGLDAPVKVDLGVEKLIDALNVRPAE